MNEHAKLIVAIGLSSLAGVVLAALALTVELPAASDTLSAATGKDASSSPICNIASDDTAPTFYSEITTVNRRMHEAMEIAPSGNAEHDFARMMIAHHQGAIDMALAELKYGRDERLRRLAQSIVVEQGQEIAYMRLLLDTPPVKTSATDPVADQ
jgi:hypothetical protein